MRKILGVLLAGALVLGACADSGDGGPDPADDPKGALVEAFRDLAEGEGVTMTLSLDSDEASLQALASDEGTELPEDTASLILDSSFTVSANNAENPEDAQAEVLFDLGGEEAAAIVVDGYDFYAHADVRYILETFGQDPAVIDQGLAQLPPGAEFVNQAVDNEWIHLTGLEQLAAQAEQSGGGGIPNLAEQQQQALDQLAAALEENSEVTEGDEEGPGTHLEAKVDLQGIVQAFEDIASEVGGGLPGTELPTDASADVPEGDFILDAWVEDGSLTQLRIDVLKNAEALEAEDVPEGVEEFGILLGIEEFDGEVDVPDDAVEVSFEDIIGMMMGGAFGSTGTESGSTAPGGTDDVCAAVAELPKAQQEAYKDICPDL
jgi:hypothetical protein